MIKDMRRDRSRSRGDERTFCGFIGSCYSTSENICKKLQSTTTTGDNFEYMPTERTTRRVATRTRRTRGKTSTSGQNLASFCAANLIGAAALLVISIILINQPEGSQCLETDVEWSKAKLIRRQVDAGSQRRSASLTAGVKPGDKEEEEEAVGDATNDDDEDQFHLRESNQEQLFAPATGQANQRPGSPGSPAAASIGQWPANSHPNDNELNRKLRIVRLFAPEAAQNGTQNVTLDCMFLMDKKKDQRLTIKWFFNEETEPIYQWIPELNQRVFADKYEHFFDKQYQVTEDVDFMLEAYKNLFHEHEHQRQLNNETNASGQQASNELEGLNNQLARAANSLTSSQELLTGATDDLAAVRKLLANRLNRHARLGSEYSRQFLQALKRTFAMDQLEFSRFRALRLIRPTTELAGRFTCSISSLESDDSRATNLVVYEPAKSFTFNVTRASNHSYNLTCQAGPAFPRPSLALFRYRAATLDSQQVPTSTLSSSSSSPSTSSSASLPPRPKLAATSLRQEPIANTQTQITISARRPQQVQGELGGREPRELHLHQTGADNELFTAASHETSNQLLAGLRGGPPSMEETPNELWLEPQPSSLQPTSAHAPYDITAWALVDESSLSGNLLTQFECVLTIEGAHYEQRQSLALQKGWHVNSSALTARSTLVGLFSALASLLCLILALVSSMLIFKLLRRHANQRRIHQAKRDGHLSSGHPSGANSVAKITSTRTSGAGGSSSSTSTTSNNSANTPTTTTDGNQSDCSTNSTAAPTGNNPAEQVANNNYNKPQQATSNEAQYIRRSHQQQASLNANTNNISGHYNVPVGQLQAYQMGQQQQSLASDGIYRVPANDQSGGGGANSTFGTRFVIGGHQQANYQRQWQQHQQQYGHLNLGHRQQAAVEASGTFGSQYVGPTGASRHLATREPNKRAEPGPESPPLAATISVNGRALYC